MNCPGNQKIIIVTPRYLPLLGGMERQVQLLAEEFARRSYRVVIITELLDVSPRQEDENGIRVIRVGARRDRPDPPTELRGLFEQVRSAVAIAYHVIRNRRGTALGIIRTFTLPSVVVGALKRVGMLRFPTVVTAETGGERDDAVLFSEFPGQFALRAALAGNDMFNALCSTNIPNILALGVNAGSVLRIPNGINCQRWISDHPAIKVQRLLYIGRLDIAKGVIDLANAFEQSHRRRPELELAYAGDGPAASELDDRIAALRLGCAIRRLGPVSYSDLPTVVREYDCVILPSHSESFGLAAYEAAAAGRHLILSDVADFRQNFGEAAWYFPPADVSALSEAIVMAADQRVAAQTAAIGCAFDVSTTADAFLAIVLRLDSQRDNDGA